jgi:hypothetical protein
MSDDSPADNLRSVASVIFKTGETMKIHGKPRENDHEPVENCGVSHIFPPSGEDT